jgi:hypothetical protein
VLENLSHPPLRIAIVAPPWFPIPPGGYGGIESMVHTLVEGLATRGHEIVLLGAGKPHRSAKFLQTYEEPPLERMGEAFPEVVHALAAADHLTDLDVDVVHDHSLAGPLLARTRRVPTVVAAHVLEGTELPAYYEELGDTIGAAARSMPSAMPSSRSGAGAPRRARRSSRSRPCTVSSECWPATWGRSTTTAGPSWPVRRRPPAGPSTSPGRPLRTPSPTASPHASACRTASLAS